MKATDCEFRRLPPGYETLGVVLDFVTRGPPYDGFAAGLLTKALKAQIAEGHHLAVVRNGILAAYAGWMPILAANGEDWIAGRAEFQPVSADKADAIAVSIVRIEGPGIARELLLRVREEANGHRAFFRKDYASKPTERRSLGLFKGG